MDMKHLNEQDRALEPPRAAVAEPDGFEVLRLWVGGGRQHVALRPETWKKPELWGIVIADFARHVANALEPDDAEMRELFVSKIAEMFNQEIAKPTSEVTGGRLPDGEL